MSVPHFISSLCLKPEGHSMITESKAIHHMLRYMAKPEAATVLHGDNASMLGTFLS